MPLEKEVFAKQLGLYASKSNYPLPEIVAEVGGKNNNDFTSYINTIFDESMFTSKEKVEAFMENPDATVLANDPLYILSVNY